MAVRKYLFWKGQEGIKTYKVVAKGKFELLRPFGKEYFPGEDWDKFIEWFEKNAAITDDENIDFCFISEAVFIPHFSIEYTTVEISTWDIEEIETFCEEYMHIGNCEIHFSSGKKYIRQISNLSKKGMKALYVCNLPELSERNVPSIDEKKELSAEAPSILTQYFKDNLKALGDPNEPQTLNN